MEERLNEAKGYLEALGIQIFLALCGHFQPGIQPFHQRLSVTDILQIPVGPKVQYLHGLGDVLHLLNGKRIQKLDAPPRVEIK